MNSANTSAAEDHHHLLDVRPGHGFDAADAVYATISTPISTVVNRSDHPRITESTTAGAYSEIPAAKPAGEERSR